MLYDIEQCTLRIVMAVREHTPSDDVLRVWKTEWVELSLDKVRASLVESYAHVRVHRPSRFTAGTLV